MPILYFNIEYTFCENGEIKIKLNAKVREDFEYFLPRIGFEFITDIKNDSFTYFGMGER